MLPVYFKCYGFHYAQCVAGFHHSSRLTAPTLADEVAAAAAANDPNGARWADRTLRKMSLEEKVGQLFMIWAKVDFMNVNGPEYVRLRDAMQKYHLGSFGITSPMDGGLLMKESPLDAAALTNQLQRDSPLPLLVCRRL